ncbi:MAG: TauD/TfdA family dioxygenase [Proteobacteria bacterium]|nr:TauD/TfdA family dioxygenase [Burkholderiales bacterium]
MNFTPISPVVGAQAHHVLLTDTNDQVIAAIAHALLEHGLLLFRRQSLSDEQLVAFGRRLGELDFSPLAFVDGQKARERPEVLIVSNVKEDGLPIGVLGDAEVVWHSDNSYRETPLSYSLLYAVELPEAGGDTCFANMYLAYETLAPVLKARLDALEIKHDLTYNSAGVLRRGFAPVTDPVNAPGPWHPIVRTHPETGYNTLYLGRRPNAYVRGLSLAESEALIDMLWAHATSERFTWTHVWQLGDVLIWDNRCLMHHRTPFDPSARRIMHRLQFVGERPFNDPVAAQRGPHPRAQAPQTRRTDTHQDAETARGMRA